jgi:hypothetical protein
MSDRDSPIDWSVTTFEGARREQLRRWAKLSLREVIQALEEMQELAVKMGNKDALNKNPFERPEGDEGDSNHR